MHCETIGTASKTAQDLILSEESEREKQWLKGSTNTSNMLAEKIRTTVLIYYAKKKIKNISKSHFVELLKR